MHATGPRTDAGKAVSSLNNLRHGLTGAFRVLGERTGRSGAVVRDSIMECQADFDAVLTSLREDHNPESATEEMLVSRMAEHAWLLRRAQRLQDEALIAGDDTKLALYLRYGTTNERAFTKCLNDLLRLRREARQEKKEFESQAARVRLANARAASLEFATELKSHVEAPLPGYSSIPLDQVKELFRSAMLTWGQASSVPTPLT